MRSDARSDGLNAIADETTHSGSSSLSGSESSMATTTTATTTTTIGGGVIVRGETSEDQPLVAATGTNSQHALTLRSTGLWGTLNGGGTGGGAPAATGVGIALGDSGTLGIPQPAHQASYLLPTRAFASFDGLHSGVPTKTTPTLTPTTLKNIEQTFMELAGDPVSHPSQAGFVPPPFQFEDHSQDREASRESMSSTSSTWQHTPPPVISEDLDSKSSSTSYERDRPGSQQALYRGGPTPTLPSLAGSIVGKTATTSATAGAGATTTAAAAGTGKASSAASAHNGGGTSSRRSMGGRRPTKSSNLTPEEEEKRRIRRQRNKEAAARCRRRREDHTNELLDETDNLEKKKQALQDEIKQLQQEKEDLEFILEAHREFCRLKGRRSPLERKPAEMQQLQQLSKFVPPPQQPSLQQQVQQVQQQQPQQLQQQQQIVLPVKIKAEPVELSDEPPSKKLILSNMLSDSLDTPTPTTIAPLLTSVNLPKGMVMTSHSGTSSSTTAVSNGTGERPKRPASLDVKSANAAAAAGITLNPLAAAAGVGISTPSSGFFNFESLMAGGTGLTPIATSIPLSSSSMNPLDLITPTSSEPSKLCSL